MSGYHYNVDPTAELHKEQSIKSKSTSLLIASIFSGWLFPPTGVVGFIFALLAFMKAQRHDDDEAERFFKWANILVVVTVALGLILVFIVMFYVIFVYVYHNESPYVN